MNGCTNCKLDTTGNKVCTLCDTANRYVYDLTTNKCRQEVDCQVPGCMSCTKFEAYQCNICDSKYKLELDGTCTEKVCTVSNCNADRCDESRCLECISSDYGLVNNECILKPDGPTNCANWKINQTDSNGLGICNYCADDTGLELYLDTTTNTCEQEVVIPGCEYQSHNICKKCLLGYRLDENANECIDETV